ncbi:hypothetical protein DFQ28_008778 [Apophysomyces sp. BC1034]|nr:hypothetical protein DFQ30_008211 [Apophysomyces sp. BC1015]KAG0182638.1 hypothetical protein DFQ29_002970 [Apophysomyces sp. BC1021]KAG0192540.1 hypothetical protein DFQ28_008778 [Apophysomyces sp. BC1034]
MGFLQQPALEIRAIALHHLVPYTPKNSEYNHLLINNRQKLCKDLKALCREDPITAHDAIRALINLSGDPRVQQELDDDSFVKYICRLITTSKSVLADLACMLLSNMTKHEPICVKLLEIKADKNTELCDSDRVMDQLVEAFHRGHKKAYNADAEYHFLASVFSNVSGIRHGRVYFLEPSSYDQLAPLTKLQIFTEDESVIRRGGVSSTIKNCCFETRQHEEILVAEKLNTLPFILLPLCGNEEYDMDEFEKFPEEIQLLDDDKKRETDTVLRGILCEALILLTTTRFGRDYLREKQVYRVIQRLHVQEKDESIGEKCISIVDMLIRDETEPEISKVKEQEQEDEDEDMIIQEIA